MRLTSQTNYAIRMLMYCHIKKDTARVGEIAEFYELPERFLFKILMRLSAGGFVETTRGRGGGIRLARPADKIRLGDVVRATETDFEMAECFREEGSDCPLIATCGLNQALTRALAGFFDILNEYTIADLAGNEHNLRVLMSLNSFLRPEERGDRVGRHEPA